MDRVLKFFDKTGDKTFLTRGKKSCERRNFTKLTRLTIAQRKQVQMHKFLSFYEFKRPQLLDYGTDALKRGT